MATKYKMIDTGSAADSLPNTKYKLINTSTWEPILRTVPRDETAVTPGRKAVSESAADAAVRFMQNSRAVSSSPVQKVPQMITTLPDSVRRGDTTVTGLPGQTEKQSIDEVIKNVAAARAQTSGEGMADIVSEQPAVLKQLSRGVISGIGGMMGSARGIAQNLNGEILEPDAYEYAQQKILQDSDNALGYQIAGAVGGMVPALAASAATGSPLVGAAVAGTGASGQSYADAKRGGSSELAARAYGAINGVSEGTLQYLLGGIGKLGSPATSALKSKLSGIMTKAIGSEAVRGAVQSAARAGIDMASEGGEEYLQAVIDPIVRNVILNEQNAFDPLNEDALDSFVVGALTAGIINAPNVVSDVGNAVSGARINAAAANAAQADSSVTNVKDVTEDLTGIGQNLHSSSNGNVSYDPTVSQDTSGVNNQYTPRPAVYATEQEIQNAAKIARDSMRNVVIVDTLNGRNGEYDPSTNTITLSRDMTGEQAALFVVKHELTHSLQGTKAYAELSDYVMNSDIVRRIATDAGATVDEMVNALVSEARADGRTISTEQAKQELVADFVGSELFTNETAIRHIAETRPSLGRRIVNFLRSMIAKFRGDKNAQFLIKAESMYTKALRQSIGKSPAQSTAVQPSSGSTDMEQRYADLIARYGAQRQGMNPARQVQAPVMNEQGSRVSRVALSAMESGIVNDTTVESVKQAIVDGAMSYQPITDMKANSDAQSKIARQGYDGALATWRGIVNGKKLPEKTDIVMAENLLRIAGQRGDTETAMELISDIAAIGTRAGQNVQALSLLRVLTPEGSLHYVNRAVDELNSRRSLKKRLTKQERERIKGLEDKIGRLREEADIAQREYDLAQSDLSALRSRRDALRHQVNSLSGRTDTAIDRASKISDALPGLMEQRDAAQAAFDEAAGRLSEARSRRDALSRELGGLESRTDTANRQEYSIWWNIQQINEKIADAEQRHAQAAQKLEKTRTAQQEINRIQKEIDKLKGSYYIPQENINDILSQTTPEGLQEARERALIAVAQQIRTGFWNKATEWRYLAMLGNPKTHFKNILGNAGMYFMSGMKDVVGAGVETVSSRTFAKGQERTKAILPAKEYRDFAKADAKKTVPMIGGGGKENPMDIFRDNTTVFRTRAIEWLRKTNSRALEKEDQLFMEASYRRAMAQYLSVNKVDLSTLSEDPETLARARQYASDQALVNTFRDSNAFAQKLNELSRSSAIANVLVEGVIPYKKTPANIVKRGVEYSPVGLATGFVNAVSGVKSGKVTATQAVEQLSAGLTGTGVMALGVWLASLGILNGLLGDDKEDDFGELQGEQGYSLNLGDLGSYTLDWLSPVIMPVFVGAEIYNQLVEKKGASFKSVMDAIPTVGDPIIQMTMLQGVQDAIENAQYSDSVLSSIAIGAASGFFNQFIPTLLGQIARTLDGTQRRTYIESDGNVPDFLQKVYQNALKKIPGASNALQPYIDEWGRAAGNGSAVENFISPGYYNEYRTSSMEKELQRLYDQTGDAAVLPGVAKKSVTVDGEDINLTGDEYTAYAVEKGQRSYQMVTSLVSSSAYKGLSDEQKAEAVGRVYKYADALAKASVTGYQLSDTDKRLRDSKVNAAQYFAIKAGASTDGNDSISQDEAKAALDKSGLPAEQKATMYTLLNSGWTTNPYGWTNSSIPKPEKKTASGSQPGSIDFDALWEGVLNGN